MSRIPRIKTNDMTRRNRKLRSVRARKVALEALESRCLLAFTPIAIPPLPLQEAGTLPGQFIVPGSTVVAKFQGNPGSFYLGTIDFGDGVTDPNAIGIEEAGKPGVYDVISLTGHTYNEENSFTIKAGMTDVGPIGDSGITTSTALVFDAPLSASAVPIIGTESPNPQTVTVATFTDPDLGPGGVGNPASDYSATIDFGSGPVPAQVQLNGPPGSYKVVVTTTFPDEIPASAGKTATVLITDTDGHTPPSGTRATATVTPSVVVNDATISVAAPTQMPTTFVEGKSSAGAVAVITDTNTGAPSTDFPSANITIDWGDGSPTSNGFAVPIGGGKFNVFGVHTYSEESTAGKYPVKVTVKDIGGQTANDNLNPGILTVSDAPLTAGSLTVNTAGVEGSTATAITATFSDGDLVNTAAGDYTAQINWGDGNTTTGTVSGNGGPGLWKVNASHTYNEEGAFPISVTIWDTDGGATTGRVNTTLTGSTTVADAPLTAGVFSINNAGTENATPTSITTTFSDADTTNLAPGDYVATIFWGDSTSSAGVVSGNGGPGLWKVNGTHTYNEEGAYQITVVITDTDGPGGSTVVPRSSVGMSSRVTVGDAPLSASPATFTATEGVPVLPTQIITSFTDANAKAPLSDFLPGSVTINWGDGTAPDTSATVSQPGGVGTPFVISGLSHIFPNESTTPFQGSIVVKDVGGSTLNIPLTTTVSEAPIVSQNPPALQFNIQEGGTVSGTIVSFVNSNPFEPPSEQVYTVTQIDWGDGTVVNNPTVTISPNFLGGFDVKASHQYGEEGTKTIKVTVKESIHANDPGSVITNTVNVTDAPLNVLPTLVTGVEGNALAAGAVLATFTDPNPADPAGAYTIQIDYGDGTGTFAGVAVSAGTAGSWNVLAASPHTYAEEGVYAPNPFTGTGGVKVTVFDSDFKPITGLTPYTATSTANIADAALVQQGTIAATTDVNTNKSIVESTSFTTDVGKFMDTNPLAANIEYAATIAWGDNSTSQGTIVHETGDPANVFTVRGTHTYLEEGTHNTTIFVNDFGGATVTLTGNTVVVQDAPLTVNTTGPQVTQEGSLFVGRIATFSDPNPFDAPGSYTVRVNWGDGPTVTLPSSAVIPLGGGNFAINASHTYTEEGSFSIAVTVFDTDGAPVTTQTPFSTTTPITVQDAPLLPGSFTVNNQGVEGPTSTPTAITATFTDTDLGNLAAGDYTAQINWGDNTTSIGVVSSNGPAGSGAWNVTGSHNYAEEGSKPISVTIWDTDGGPTTGRINITLGGTATVADAPLTAGLLTVNTAGTEGSVATAITATFSDGDTGNNSAGDYVATINWGDGNATTGTVSSNGGPGLWKVNGSHTYAEEGLNQITVTIVDTDGLLNPGPGRGTAGLTGATNVADAALQPGILAVNTAGVEGSTATAITATFNDGDLLNTAAGDYFAQIDWGGGVVTTGTVSANGPAGSGQWKVTGSNTYAEEGAKSITVTIWDTDGGATTGRVNTSVSGTTTVADAPLRVVSAPFNLVATEGTPQASPLSLVVFQDANPGAPVADFLPVSAGGEGGSVTVNWGDNTPTVTLPASAIQPVGSGYFFVRASHVFAEDGVYTATITVTDGGGASQVSTTAKITVNDAPLSDFGNPQKITGTVNAPLTTLPQGTLLGTVKDADPGAIAADYTGSINWGDGTALDTNVTFTPGLVPGTFNVFGNHTYTTFGIFNITVVVTDSDGHLITPPGVLPRGTAILTGTTANIT